MRYIFLVVVAMAAGACAPDTEGGACRENVRIVKVITKRSWCSAVVANDGIVFTAAHCEDPILIVQGSEIPVVSAHALDRYDASILEAPGAKKTWTGGTAAGYGHGEEVVLEGYGHGCGCVVRHGRARAVSGGVSWPEGETDISACPGDSGGAVFNVDGDLIGVTWGGWPGRSVFTRADFVFDEMEGMGI